MAHTDNQLSPETARILKAQRRATILSGAGISIDEPSNVPSATNFIHTTLESICDTPARTALTQCGTNLNALLASPPRFEAFLEAIRENLDGSLGLLDLIKNVRSTNLNHSACAQLIHNGAHHVTLNLDTLIEQAAQQAGTPLHRLATDQDFKTWRGKPALAKLHGSLDMPQTIRATLDTVGKGVDGFVYEPARRRFLQEILLSRPLIVVGYSGSDDFDVTPFLLTHTSNQAIIWVQHTAAPPRVVSIRSSALIPEKTVRLLRTLKDGPRRRAQVHLVLGNTTTVLTWLAHRDGNQPRAFPGTRHPDVSKVIRTWLSRLKPRPERRRLLLAEILVDRHPGAASHMYMTTLKTRNRPADGINAITSKALFRLSAIAGNNGDYDRARDLLTQAYERPQSSPPDHRANCLLCLGNLAFDTGDNNTALRHYHAAATAFRIANSRLGVNQARFQIGRILLNQGYCERAKKCFTQVKRHLEKAGHMISLAVALNLLAATETLEGQEELAEAHLEESIRITSRLEGAKRTHAAALRGRAFLHMLCPKRRAPDPIADVLRARKIYLSERDLLGVAACYYLHARIKEKTRPDLAARHYRTAIQLAQKLRAKRAIAVSQLGLARCLADSRASTQHYIAARSILLQTGSMRQFLPPIAPEHPSILDTLI